MEWRMSERADGGGERGEPAVRGQDHCCHHPYRKQDGQDGHTDTEHGVHTPQVVPAHRDVAPGAEDPPGIAERTGGQQDEPHHDDGAGDVAMSSAEKRYPDHGPEQEPDEESAESEDLDQGTEP